MKVKFYGGMDEETFQESLHDFCRCFVCPDCPNWNDEFKDCEMDYEFCVYRAYKLLQTHELYRAKRDYYGEIWKCRPKEGDSNDNKE